MLKNIHYSLKFACVFMFFVLSAIIFYSISILSNNFLHNFSLIASAETEPIDKEVTIIKTGEKLYEELLFIRDGKYPEDIDNAKPLRKNTFSSLENLDLSGKQIKDIYGLYFFDFNNLKQLNLSHNEIEKVPTQTFYNFNSLKILDLSYNKINEINFVNPIKIQSLNLEHNNLTNINLQNINNIEASNGSISLAKNKFTSIKNISLPSISAPKNIELFGNNILDVQPNKNFAPHQLNFIVQSIYNNIEINDKTLIDIFPSFNENNYYLNAINLATMQSQKLYYNNKNYLPKGNYKIEIFNNEINLSSDTNINNIYKSFEIKVLKSAPTVKAYIKNKLIEPNEKIIEPVTLKFDSGSKDYNVYYSINGANFEYGNSIILDKNGQYNIVVKGVNSNNETSQLLTIGVTVAISQFNFLLILLITLCITTISLIVLLLLKWIKSK